MNSANTDFDSIDLSKDLDNIVSEVNTQLTSVVDNFEITKLNNDLNYEDTKKTYKEITEQVKENLQTQYANANLNFQKNTNSKLSLIEKLTKKNLNLTENFASYYYLLIFFVFIFLFALLILIIALLYI
jgi:hypothetical protein